MTIDHIKAIEGITVTETAQYIKITAAPGYVLRTRTPQTESGADTQTDQTDGAPQTADEWTETESVHLPPSATDTTIEIDTVEDEADTDIGDDDGIQTAELADTDTAATLSDTERLSRLEARVAALEADAAAQTQTDTTDGEGAAL